MTHCVTVQARRQPEYPGGSRDWGLVETLHLGATFFEAAADFSLFTTTTSTVNHSAGVVAKIQGLD